MSVECHSFNSSPLTHSIYIIQYPWPWTSGYSRQSNPYTETALLNSSSQWRFVFINQPHASCGILADLDLIEGYPSTIVWYEMCTATPAHRFFSRNTDLAHRTVCFFLSFLILRPVPSSISQWTHRNRRQTARWGRSSPVNLVSNSNSTNLKS